MEIFEVYCTCISPGR